MLRGASAGAVVEKARMVGRLVGGFMGDVVGGDMSDGRVRERERRGRRVVVGVRRSDGGESWRPRANVEDRGVDVEKFEVLDQGCVRYEQSRMKLARGKTTLHTAYSLSIIAS